MIKKKLVESLVPYNQIQSEASLDSTCQNLEIINATITATNEDNDSQVAF